MAPVAPRIARSRGISTYTDPGPSTWSRSNYESPALLPVYPHPRTKANPPPLPKQESRTPIPGYTLSRHVYPAAYPRTLSGAVKTKDSKKLSYLDDPFGPVASSDKEKRKALIVEAAIVVQKKAIRATEQQLRTREEAERVAKEGSEPVLWIAANRFLRSNSQLAKSSKQSGISLVVVHANGYCKEMWEPMLKTLLSSEDGKSMSVSEQVDEVWTLDLANHGESYGLNDGMLGDVFSWSDVARDIVSLTRHCLSNGSSTDDTLPANLPFDSNASSSKPRGRRFIGIGHSIGGNGLVQAAHADKDLFDQLILVDPMTRYTDGSDRDKEIGLSLGRSCVGRRNIWKSREEARTDLLRSPYFQAWSPSVFSSFITHGLVDLPPSEKAPEQERDVTLAMPRWAEAASFNHGSGTRDGWNKLKGLSQDLRVDFVMAGKPDATGGAKLTREMVWRPPNAHNSIIEASSHLISQEHPDMLAAEIARVLAKQSTAEAKL